jgi:lipoprotein signal peptidase
MKQLSFWQRVGVIGGVVFIDQLSKWLVTLWRPELIQLNQQMAFSQNFFGLSIEFWVMSTGILVFVLGMMVLRVPTAATLPAALLVGGGVSNWLDRWWLGGVRDWMEIPFIGLNNNLADYALTAAVLIWMWQNLSD